MARAAAADAGRAWQRHRKSCPTCEWAADRHRWVMLCPAGAEAREERDRLRAKAAEEAELDKRPAPGQGTLFDLPEIPS
jgi:hypothetical protein